MAAKPAFVPASEKKPHHSLSIFRAEAARLPSRDRWRCKPPTRIKSSLREHRETEHTLSRVLPPRFHRDRMAIPRQASCHLQAGPSEDTSQLFRAQLSPVCSKRQIPQPIDIQYVAPKTFRKDQGTSRIQFTLPASPILPTTGGLAQRLIDLNSSSGSLG